MNTTPRFRRAIASCAAGAAIAMIATTPASAQDSEEFRGTFGQMNDSGLSGDVTVTLTGTSAEITLNANGVVDLVHAQHIHGEYGVDNTCPTDDLDVDGDGFVNTVEGVPNYGTVKASLVTEGPTDESYALAIESFPVASGGSYEYTRTIEVPQDLADNMENMIIVVHGVDLDGSGAYDGDAASPLDEDLPLEATLPAGCATLVLAGATPVGGVAAGGGGSATDTSSAGLMLAIGGLGAAVLLAGVSITGTRRRQA